MFKNQYLCGFQIFMKYKLFLISVAILAFSCGDSSEEKDQEPLGNASIVFGEEGHNFPQLSEPAKQETVHWGVLEDFLSVAKNLNGSNFQDVRNRSERLQQFSDSLVKSIPPAFDTRPINSRLVVLKTRADLLYQTSHQDFIDSIGLQNTIWEMNSAVDNLIVHLNEKFKKERIDSQRKENEDMELKKQQRFKDSIIKLELQDQNRKKV